TYDEHIGRFIVGDQDVETNVAFASIFHLAVSKTSSPATLTAADWNFYDISTTENLSTGMFPGYVGTPDDFDADYPGNFGYNADAFVFTLNMFDTGGGGTGHVLVTSVDGGDLAAGVPQAALNFFQNDYMGFSLRPTTMHDALPGDPMWLLTEG